MNYLLIDGAQWAYEEQGSGPPLMLVHGFPLDRRFWSRLMVELAPQFRVISIDLPGFGESTLQREFTIESLASGVANIAKFLNLGKFFAAGLSMGGYICQALASKHMSELAGLAPLDTKAAADDEKQKQGRNKMIELARTGGSKAVADEMLGKLLSPTTIRGQPQLVRGLRAMMEAVPPATIEVAQAAMRDRLDYTSLLPKLTLPLQIITGIDDELAPPAIAEAMHKAAPNSTLTIVPDAGHLTPLEQPARVADALRSFLA